jgi:NAD(P)H-quinone oxidoreductase subunit 5
MFKNIFYMDQLSILMLFIINLVGISIIFFSRCYLQADNIYKKYMFTTAAILTSLSLMSITDHIGYFLLFWGMSNFLLVQLIIHKKSWQQALNSGIIAGKYFIFSFIMILCGMGLLAYYGQTTSIQIIVHTYYPQNILNFSLILILLGIMVQSAIWPFHRWLISSVNAPTTVSALMHAGLVNGGGFLLAKLFNLYAQSPVILNIIFLLGLCTAIFGTLSKLIQPDIKKMFACSTIGQMGFMFMEFGLGLVPAAVAHICYHGFFKAYLFLRSASTIHEKRLYVNDSPTVIQLFKAVIAAIPGIVIFSYVSDKALTIANTNLIILIVVFVTLVQSCVVIVSESKIVSIASFLTAIGFATLLGSVYGFFMYQIEHFLKPVHLIEQLQLELMHVVGLTILVTIWLVMIFSNYLKNILSQYSYMQKIYVLILNASQPYPKTITAHRNDYDHV